MKPLRHASPGPAAASRVRSRPAPPAPAPLPPGLLPGLVPGLVPAPTEPANDLDADLRQIVGELCDIVGAARGTLYLCDERTGDLDVHYTYVAAYQQVYVPGPELLRALLPGADRIWQQILATLQPYLITDAQNDPILSNRELMRELGIVSILEVPLVVGGTRVIGMVAVARAAHCPEFDSAAIRVACSFATQAALAIENTRLHARAAKQAEQLALVNEVGRRIHAILDPERLLDELAALITSSFHYSYTAIYLAEGATLQARAAHSAAVGRDARLTGRHLALDGPSLAGWVVRHNRPLTVADVRTQPEYFAGVGLPEAGSALAVPLPVWHGVRGALVVHAAQPGAFDDGDRTLMEALAGQITVALANASLYRQAEDRAAALATANARLAELDQLKSDFLSMVSHELRTPLGLIKGYVGTLLAPELPLAPAIQQEFLGVIDEETDALSELVDNLLDMSRIEAGTLRVDPQPTDLAGVLAGAADTLRQRFPLRWLEVSIARDLPPVWVDGRRIAQVLVNLLENAAKYSPDDTPIVLAAVPACEAIQVTVRDHGPGIPAAALPHIFDKFYRAVQENRVVGGSGLGLTIARGIVETHGGRIWAESAPGQGAAFHFTVPLVKRET